MDLTVQPKFNLNAERRPNAKTATYIKKKKKILQASEYEVNSGIDLLTTSMSMTHR